MEQTYYELLRVSQDAPQEVIHAAYRALMVSFPRHPDLGGDEETAVQINLAFETLSDPRKRARYDQELTSRHPQAPGKGERRRAERFDTEGTISYCLGHDNRWYVAHLKDLSSLGMR